MMTSELCIENISLSSEGIGNEFIDHELESNEAVLTQSTENAGFETSREDAIFADDQFSLGTSIFIVWELGTSSVTRGLEAKGYQAL